MAAGEAGRAARRCPDCYRDRRGNNRVGDTARFVTAIDSVDSTGSVRVWSATAQPSPGPCASSRRWTRAQGCSQLSAVAASVVADVPDRTELTTVEPGPTRSPGLRRVRVAGLAYRSQPHWRGAECARCPRLKAACGRSSLRCPFQPDIEPRDSKELNGLIHRQHANPATRWRAAGDRRTWRRFALSKAGGR